MDERERQLRDIMFGWVQIHETRYRDNGDNTYTTITSATHYGHDGRVIKKTENEQSTIYVPPKSGFDIRKTGVEVFKD